MTNVNMVVLGSSTNYDELQMSGTVWKQQQSIPTVLLCGVSGNAILPVRLDGTGAIENTT